ncbi:hypothetical protein MACH10_31060 [Thalassospira tepidiphila]|nr:hypothetical protein MACH10_31060 [Thalassospira tepidiphila]
MINIHCIEQNFCRTGTFSEKPVRALSAEFALAKHILGRVPSSRHFAIFCTPIAVKPSAVIDAVLV